MGRELEDIEKFFENLNQSSVLLDSIDFNYPDCLTLEKFINLIDQNLEIARIFNEI